jgi:putative DeoR family transcriptional regulator (stage III sporulation protein D)
LKGLPEERCVQIGNYIADNNVTVRSAAKTFNISKSTVHKDVSERLKKTNRGLYKKVQQVLERNKSERHIRGGLATKRKYEEMINTYGEDKGRAD